MPKTTPKTILALLVPLLLASATQAEDSVKSAVSTLTSPSAELSRRLDAVDRLTKLNATPELLRAWADGGVAVRIAVPVGFHAIGVRGLGSGLTALGDERAEMRAAGAVLLGSIGRNARLGVRKLLIALTDESELVQRCAADALGSIGTAADEATLGLIALAVRNPKLALPAMQAMSRITLDVQLYLQRKKLPEPVRKVIVPAKVWLTRQQHPNGSWGDDRTTALVVLALAEGGLTDGHRGAVRRAFRHLVLKFSRRPRAEPMVLLATHATIRETRDPLLRILAERIGERVLATVPEPTTERGWRLLALQGARWSGSAIDPAIFTADVTTEPKLLALALATKFDATKAKESAERTVANKIVWTDNEVRWNPETLVASAWAIQLTGGQPEIRFRKLMHMAALPSQLKVDAAAGRWEPPAGVDATTVEMTAAVVIALNIVNGRYPPRRLPMPKSARQKVALSALRGCLKHDDPAVVAYAKSMLSLWK